MTDAMVRIMVEVLDILATATKEILKKVAGVTNLEDGTKRLYKVKDVNGEVQVVNNSVKVIEEKVQLIVRKWCQPLTSSLTVSSLNGKAIAEEVRLDMLRTADDDMKRNQLRDSLKKWQSPSDPSTNHNIACGRQHGGTIGWFCQGSVFGEWKLTGSLLWIHGKPGSGKTILCSAIIEDVMILYDDLWLILISIFGTPASKPVAIFSPHFSSNFLRVPIPFATCSPISIRLTTTLVTAF
ncbi:hypothetical protein EDB85DRAFT_135784 [Lactarius pseudohatsudake]|nr:hypothetical protein EDB85DRAFT_135784 [Lactarius pseudohatsudake]